MDFINEFFYSIIWYFGFKFVKNRIVVVKVDFGEIIEC